VAAHLDPEILVVDEVLAVGDAEFQRKCLGKMSEVCESGRTILFVSHNMIAIRELCSRSILLEAGRVMAEGDSNTVISRYLDRDNQQDAVLTREMIDKSGPNYQGVTRGTIQISEIRLQDKTGIPRNQYYSDEEIEVVIEYECLTQITDLVIVLSLSDEYRQPIFSNSNKDYSNDAYRHAAGLYKASCVIPANLLGGKRFMLSVKLLIPGEGRIILPLGLWFEVDFTGQHGRGFAISPRLPVGIEPRNDKLNLSQFPPTAIIG
jgi:lipopolysaccharide transport system ATP-binding protein